MLDLIGQSEIDEEIVASLRQVPLFSGLSARELAMLAARAHTLRLDKGKLIYVSGERAHSYYLVKSGWVRLFRETLDGAQATRDILTAGHLFGETALFHNGTYDSSAEVVEDGVFLSLPLSDLQSLLAQSGDFARAMLGSIAQENQAQGRELEHRDIQTAPQRIGCFLLRLIPTGQLDGPVTIHLPYDKTLVAARLGMQPETFSRALARLRDETGIRIKGATIEFDSIEQITHFTCAACSSSFPCDDLPAKKSCGH